MAIIGALVAIMLPFDLIGGFLLSRAPEPLGRFTRRWIAGVGLQSVMFLGTGLGILTATRIGGIGLAGAWVAFVALAFIALQGHLARVLTRPSREEDDAKVQSAWNKLTAIGLKRLPVVVAEHHDPGFTGGIVGLPKRELLVVPRLWVERFREEELAVMLARRVVAVTSGSRTRGLLFALGWVVIGFVLAAQLPGAGGRTVAELLSTCCGFTIWSFAGLLILPTLSRQAAYTIDRRVLSLGLGNASLNSLLENLEDLQGEDRQRPAWIEAIFHPVPCVANRQQMPLATAGGWHAARMMLFLSWACLGPLSRAVHCNAGRPELWILLPTD